VTFHNPLVFDAPVRSPSDYCLPVWFEKTRMLGLPDGEKSLTICLSVLTECTNVTDRQTDRHAHRHRMTAKAALDARGQKTIVSLSLRLNSTWTDPATSFLCSRAGNKETMVTDNSVARSLHVKILHTTTIVNWYLYQSHDHILSSLTKHL